MHQITYGPGLQSIMTRYDLNGNPIEDSPASSSSAAPTSPASSPTGDASAPLRRNLNVPGEIGRSVADNQADQSAQYAAPGSAAHPVQDNLRTPQYSAGSYVGAQQPLSGSRRPDIDIGESSRKIAITVGSVLLVTLVCVYTVMAHPMRLKAPTQYRDATLPDGTGYVTPNDWERTKESIHESLGELGIVCAVSLQKQSAGISIESQTVSIAPPNAPDEPPDQLVKEIHDRANDSLRSSAAEFGSHYRDFHQTEPKQFDTHFGSGAIVEWTARGEIGDLPRVTHGFRAVLISGPKVLSLDSSCLQEDWTTMRSPFLYEFENIKDTPAL